jgi:hypothetical protein
VSPEQTSYDQNKEAEDREKMGEAEMANSGRNMAQISNAISPILLSHSCFAKTLLPFLLKFILIPLITQV